MPSHPLEITANRPLAVLAPDSPLVQVWPARIVPLRYADAVSVFFYGSAFTDPLIEARAYVVDLRGIAFERLVALRAALASRGSVRLMQTLAEVPVRAEHFAAIFEEGASFTFSTGSDRDGPAQPVDSAPAEAASARATPDGTGRPDPVDASPLEQLLAVLAVRALDGDQVAADAYEHLRARA